MHCLISYELVIKVYNLENWIFSTGGSFIYSGFSAKGKFTELFRIKHFSNHTIFHIIN